MPSLFFLPGVGGSAGFWQPLADLLPADWNTTFFAWPGLGPNPPDPAITSYDDLIDLVASRFGDQPVDLLAQSMGGAIALSLAIRYPEKVRRLVLAVTAGGLDVSLFGASDWRADYHQEFPLVADWVMTQRPDISAQISQVTHPVLLIWGDRDPISPPAVGRHLHGLLPNSQLMIVPGGHHDLVAARPADIAEAIRLHLRPTS